MKDQRLIDTIWPGGAEDYELSRARHTFLNIPILNEVWWDSLAYIVIYRNAG